MIIFGHDLGFWLAAFGAAALKVVLSPWFGLWKGVLSVFTAVVVAILFTDPVVAYLNLNPQVYKIAVAALIALTGEGIVRWILQLVTDPAKILEIVKVFRGGGK